MRCLTRCLRNDKAFSLVEVLVVMAIMAILTGGAVASIAIVNNANVNKAANALDNAFTKARTIGMAKGSSYHFQTVMVGNTLYAYIGDPATGMEKEKISGGGVSVVLPASSDYTFSADGSVRGVTGNVKTVYKFTHGERTAEFWFHSLTGEHGVTLN